MKKILLFMGILISFSQSVHAQCPAPEILSGLLRGKVSEMLVTELGGTHIKGGIAHFDLTLHQEQTPTGKTLCKYDQRGVPIVLLTVSKGG